MQAWRMDLDNCESIINILMDVGLPIHRLLLPLLFLNLLTVNCLDNYDMEHTVNCKLIDNDWSLRQNLSYLWNIVVLHEVDRFAFLVGSPLIMVFQVVLIFSLCKFKLYRSSPMDIILVCFISEFALNICYFANAIYYTVYSYKDPMPELFPAYCMTSAIVNTMFSILEMIYLLFFLVYTMLSVKKSIKKNQWFQTNYKHVIPVVITLVCTFLIGMLDWYGLSQFGFCTITSTRNSDVQVYFPIVEISFVAVFVFFAFFSYRYFRQHMPDGVALNRRKYEQNELMSRFVIGMSIILMIFVMATLALYFNCLNPNPLMLIWATIYNITKLIEFLYLIFVMLGYKKIGNKVKKLFRGLFSTQSEGSVMVIREKRLTEKELVDFIDVGMKEKILDIQEEENQIDFIRITQVMTILMGIKIAYQEYLGPTQNNIDRINDLKNLLFHEEVSFQIGPKLIKDYEQAAHILPRISLLRGKFTIFAPRVFARLLVEDNVGQIWQSFQLMENRNQLYRIVQGDGGRSGEFFFFTSDCRYIFKTLNKEEFYFLLEYLEDFYGHFLTYPHTLIAKPYGMFKIENREVNQSYYIILMKNNAGCDREWVLRTYDMKGSTHDRMTLKHNEQQWEIGNKVLKDLDFRRLEHQLDIDVSMAKELRTQLRIDTEFLMDLNLIDYSLLVMRIKGEQSQPQFWGRLARLPSTVSPGEYYHIALIDYLQKWDLGKKSEKWWKNLFGKHDVSAQQPTVYQFRFMKFLQEITACDSHRVTREALSREPTIQRQTEMPRLTNALKKIHGSDYCTPGELIKEDALNEVTQ